MLFDALEPLIPDVFARYGVRAEHLRPLETFAPSDTVLLTGSYARGEATSASDLDLTAICVAPPARPPGVRGYPSIFGDSVVAARIGDLVVNVEWLRRDILCTVCDLLAGATGDPPSPSIANLGPLEVRALDRAGGGIALRATDADAHLLAGIDLAKARANTAALGYIACRGQLRAAAAAGTEALTRRIRLREAAESLLLAELNALGVLTYDVKHLAQRVLRAAGPDHVRLLHGLAGSPEPDPAEFAAEIDTLARRFASGLDDDEQRKQIGALLRPVLAGR